MKDYEQLYYDLLYENRKLKEENENLKLDLNELKKYSKLLDIKKEIIKEFKNYKRRSEYEDKKHIQGEK